MLTFLFLVCKVCKNSERELLIRNVFMFVADESPRWIMEAMPSQAIANGVETSAYQPTNS